MVASAGVGKGLVTAGFLLLGLYLAAVTRGWSGALPCDARSALWAWSCGTEPAQVFAMFAVVSLSFSTALVAGGLIVLLLGSMGKDGGLTGGIAGRTKMP